MTDANNSVNQGNAYANMAEEYLEKGHISKAIEAHFRAAEQFLLATNYSPDIQAQQTLKLLYKNHTKKGKDLQKRQVAASSVDNNNNNQQQQQQQHAAAVIPHSKPTEQKYSSSSFSSTLQSNKPGLIQPKSTGFWPEEGDAGSGYGSRHFYLSQTSDSSNPQKSKAAEPATVPVQSLDASITNTRPKIFEPESSAINPDQSYFLLDEDPPLEEVKISFDDPFNKFWEGTYPSLNSFQISKLLIVFV
jgi:hypothetical protein